MIGQMPLLQVCLDLTILDVRRPLLFFSETVFIYNFLLIVQKCKKIIVGSSKNFKISVYATFNPAILRLQLRRVKLWSLNANLFFEEPHQLTPFKPYLAGNVSLQSSNCNILGLATTVAFFANEARFTQIQVFLRACSLQNKAGDPHFFTLLTSLTHHLSMVKFSGKNQLENFRPGVKFTVWTE